MDLSVVRRRVRDFRLAMGEDLAIRYAVKCNSTPRVLSAIADEGAGFEIASLAELDLAVRVGAQAADVVFSAPVKQPHQLAAAAEQGVRWFAVGSPGELHKVASVAGTESCPLLRLKVADHGSRWPQSPTWGLSVEGLVALMAQARRIGFAQIGVMFHVGSQAVPGLWAAALAQVADLMRACPVELSVVDVGGGFPVSYQEGDDAHLQVWRRIGMEIAEARDRLPYQPAQWLAEPGRALVADAGTFYTSVVDVDLSRRFVHTDIGVFHGLYESSAAGGGLELEWCHFDRDLAIVEPMRVGGITCDSDDVLAAEVPLPVDLQIGETLAVRQAGAYSLSYAGRFCGLEPPQVVLSEGPRAPRPDYEVVTLGSPAFAEAVALELEMFERAGYLEADGTLSSFRRYDDICRFLITRGRDGRIGTALRVADASSMGFSALHTLPVSQEGWQAVTSVGLDSITEVITLSSARASLRASLDAYAACWYDTRARGRDHAVAAIDTRVLHMVEQRLGLTVERLGPPVHYLGSPTVAVLFGFQEQHQDGMRRQLLGSMVLDVAGSGVAAGV
jgi:ornithine decarboxylase